MELEDAFDRTTLEILDFLLDNPVMDYSKKEIAELSGVSRTTVHRKWDILEGLELVEETRKYQNTQLYSLDQDSEIVKLLGQLMDEVERRELVEVDKVPA
ncbi:MAG: winged helix-turn-helix domain-containing protein [Candidatus Nanohaloarchaeota archaeon QJJ-7]|nr:winged helix-turn-helix domain-containing protein [Candidatus Nanohaloarchaeota archaeon QJJ-7]